VCGANRCDSSDMHEMQAQGPWRWLWDGLRCGDTGAERAMRLLMRRPQAGAAEGVPGGLFLARSAAAIQQKME